MDNYCLPPPYTESYYDLNNRPPIISINVNNETNDTPKKRTILKKIFFCGSVCSKYSIVVSTFIIVMIILVNVLISSQLLCVFNNSIDNFFFIYADDDCIRVNTIIQKEDNTEIVYGTFQHIPTGEFFTGRKYDMTAIDGQGASKGTKINEPNDFKFNKVRDFSKDDKLGKISKCGIQSYYVKDVLFLTPRLIYKKPYFLLLVTEILIMVLASILICTNIICIIIFDHLSHKTTT